MMSDPFMPLFSLKSGVGFKAADGVYGLTVQIANVYFIENPSAPGEIILVDAGMPQSAEMITEEMKRRFGDGYQLKAVMLTHGHFDHVGAIEEPLEMWDVPVYIHEQELPYVTGKADYPPARPDAKKGLVAKLSPLFPRHAIRIPSVQTLPSDGTVPFLEEWKWVHTPGIRPAIFLFFGKKTAFCLPVMPSSLLNRNRLRTLSFKSKSFTARRRISQRIRRLRQHPSGNWPNWSRKRF